MSGKAMSTLRVLKSWLRRKLVARAKGVPGNVLEKEMFELAFCWALLFTIEAVLACPVPKRLFELLVLEAMFTDAEKRDVPFVLGA